MDVYILKLEGGKYYVGKSKDPKRRFEQHKSGAGGRGAEWTKLHRPIEILKIIENGDEDVITIQQMDEHLMDNVRGGSFCNTYLTEAERKVIRLAYEHGVENIRDGKVDIENLSNAEKKVIKKFTSTLNDLCHKCQSSGHFASNCPEKKQKPKEEDEPQFTTVEVNGSSEDNNNTKYMIYLIIFIICCPCAVALLCCYCFVKISAAMDTGHDIESAGDKK